MIKLLALREKFDHMSNYSGYDRLYKYLKEDISVNSVNANFKKRYPRGVGRVLANIAKMASPSWFYNAQSVEAEATLLMKSWRHSYDIIHYSYGEPYWGLGGRFRKLIKPAIVITNHQPISWWQANTALLNKYKLADKVITLSEFDRDYFNETLPGKAVCIPHGVDTDFFQPAVLKYQSSAFRVIFAGRYLRDIPTLLAVIKTLSATISDIQFDLVVAPNKQDLQELSTLSNVNYYIDITEQQLRGLYQQAHCCLIPLLDCTANNAILEAMACGLPIVSTNLPAIKTYLDDSCSILGRRQSADDLCEAVKVLYHNPALLDKMGLAARNKALTQFSWPIVAATTGDLFKSLA